MNYTAVIVAAGRSERFGRNKMLHVLPDGQTVVEKTLELFRDDPDCKQIVVAVSKPVVEYLVTRRNYGRQLMCYGGETRQESVWHCLLAVSQDHVMVHDGARCFLKREDLERLKQEMEKEKAVVLATRETDTVKKIDGDYITGTVDRRTLVRAQTPQCFETDLLTECYRKAEEEGYKATDDCQLVEKYGNCRIRFIESSGLNTKITTPRDLEGE